MTVLLSLPTYPLMMYPATMSVSQPVRNLSQLHRCALINFSVIVCGAYVYNLEVKHNEHLDHLRAENDGKLPEPPAYEYLNRRVKPFPWGANSLFFNPAVCALDFTFCRV